MGGGGADVKGGGGSGGSRAFTLPNSAFSASWSPHDRRALQGGAYDAYTLARCLLHREVTDQDGICAWLLGSF
jgi:hypothetical protein